MSSQTMADEFAKCEAKRSEEIMRATWGHLAPKRGKKYTGFILFCHASDGSLCPIDYDLKGLGGSPWLHDAIVGFIANNAKEQGQIYRFDGVFLNYEFIGTVKTITS